MRQGCFTISDELLVQKLGLPESTVIKYVRSSMSQDKRVCFVIEHESIPECVCDYRHEMSPVFGPDGKLTDWGIA